MLVGPKVLVPQLNAQYWQITLGALSTLLEQYFQSPIPQPSLVLGPVPELVLVPLNCFPL